MTLSPLLTGENLRLTALTRDDIPMITRWYQDADFMRLYDATPARPRDDGDIGRWLEREQKNKDVFLFAIRPISSDDLIGFIDLSGILWTQGTGWLGIAIGDPGQRGRGYGREAVTLMLDFAFRELNLHRVQLTVFAYNTAALALYEKLGFTREGIHREALHREGQRYDMILFGILRREWGGR